MYKQNEIVLIPFPYTDLTGTKQRPALIISNQLINSGVDRLCCLITSKESANGIEIKNSNMNEGKLPFKSWIKPHRIFTVNSKIIKRKLCSINNQFHKEIIKDINKIIK